MIILCITAIVYIALFYKDYLDEYVIYWLYLVALISILLQLMYFRYDSERIVLSVIDPNFSSLYMLLFFYMCSKKKLWIGIVLSIFCLFLFQSRNYFLAIAVFCFVSCFKSKFQYFFTKYNSLFFWLILLNIFLLIVSFSWVHYGIGKEGKYEHGVERLVQFVGKSNYKRFKANVDFVNYGAQHFVPFMMGAGNLKEKIGKTDLLEDFSHVPHNATIHLILSNGLLFTFFYLLYLSRLIKPFFNFENLEYIISYIVFSLFLHGGFVGTEVIMLFFILMMKKSNKPVAVVNKAF